MKLCIVGQGPSAKGRGREIDACDFVVRMKAYWRVGAEDAGEKIDAWAWYGHIGSSDRGGVPREDLSCVPSGIEHWFTHCPCRLVVSLKTARLPDAMSLSGSDPFHQLSDDLWNRAVRHIGYHPSTGFVAICMGLDRFPNAELVLYGFDSTTTDKPNFWDARGCDGDKVKLAHRVDIEKRVIAEIQKGTWLRKPTAATLAWPDMPDMGDDRA